MNNGMVSTGSTLKEKAVRLNKSELDALKGKVYELQYNYNIGDEEAEHIYNLYKLCLRFYKLANTMANYKLSDTRIKEIQKKMKQEVNKLCELGYTFVYSCLKKDEAVYIIKKQHEIKISVRGSVVQ